MRPDERYTVLQSAIQQVVLRTAEIDELFVDFQTKFSQKNAELRQEQQAIRTEIDHLGLALSSSGSHHDFQSAPRVETEESPQAPPPAVHRYGGITSWFMTETS